MKVIFDTNVIFSAFATRGLAHAVFELCLERHTILISETILSELFSHLQNKLKMPSENVHMLISYLKESCLLSEEAFVDNKACRDKKDIHILGLAEKMHPEFIVTGDEDLLVLKKYRKTLIVTPREFWEKEKKKNK
jgi:uncharacterized protein